MVLAKREKHVVSTCLNCNTIKRYNLVNNNKKTDKVLKKKKKLEKKKKRLAKEKQHTTSKNSLK